MRLQIMLSQDELAAVDEWRFRERMPSRASAIRALLQRGLLAGAAPAPAARTMSEDLGARPETALRGED